MNEVPDELKKTINSYKFTVAILCLSIFAVVCVFVWVVLFKVPEIVAYFVHKEIQAASDDIIGPRIHKEVQQAFTESLEINP